MNSDRPPSNCNRFEFKSTKELTHLFLEIITLHIYAVQVNCFKMFLNLQEEHKRLSLINVALLTFFTFL